MCLATLSSESCTGSTPSTRDRAPVLPQNSTGSIHTPASSDRETQPYRWDCETCRQSSHEESDARCAPAPRSTRNTWELPPQSFVPRLLFDSESRTSEVRDQSDGRKSASLSSGATATHSD